MPEIKKILFLCEAQLGDLLLLTPAFRAVKKHNPDTEITVLLMHRRGYSHSIPAGTLIQKTAFEGTSQVFLNNPDVDLILELDRNRLKMLKGLKRYRTEWLCIQFLKKMDFDAAVCTFPQSRFVLWAFLAGIKKRVGQKKVPFSRMLTHKPDIETRSYGVLKYYCDLLKPLGIEVTVFDTVYNITDEEKRAARTLLESNHIETSQQIICIHPGASENHKVWPAEFFAETADYIINNNMAQFFICSHKYDREVTEQICRFAKNKLTVLNVETIRELGAVISFCSICIVNNSGPRHMAAATGVKNISIFQRYDNGEWKIYENSYCHVIESRAECRFCKGNNCHSVINNGNKFGSQCMRDVSVQSVINKINEIL